MSASRAVRRTAFAAPALLAVLLVASCGGSDELTMYSGGWQRFIPIQVGGRTKVDVEGMHDRVEELLASALTRP